MIIILICLETVYDTARNAVKDSKAEIIMLFTMSISPHAIRRYIRGRN